MAKTIVMTSHDDQMIADMVETTKSLLTTAMDFQKAQ